MPPLPYKQAEVKRLPFRPDIEGLRAIAILLVVGTHAGVPWLEGGFIGVDVFFVLSGFLITGKLVHEVSITGRIKLLPFYVNRIRRLLPALLLMLLLVGWASTWLLSPLELPAQFNAARMAALWLSNIYFAFGKMEYFSAGSERNLYLHTWSLGVEEQFYLLWPALLLWMLLSNGQSTVRLKVGMVVVFAASLLACILITRVEPLLAFYMMPLRAWQFAAGALVWLVYARAAQAPPLIIRAAPAIGLLGLGLILACGVWFDARRPYPGAWAILPTLGTASALVAGSLPSGRTGIYRLLSLSLLQWLGRVSYSWYLWHWPVLLLGYSITNDHSPEYRATLLAFSLMLATISLVLVETPLRRWSRWQVFPRTAVLASFAGMIAICMLVGHWSRHSGYSLHSTQIQRYATARGDAPIIYKMGCDEWYHSASVRICKFGDVRSTHTAILIGDSHAGQWFPAVRRALEQPGWQLLVITKSSCPMVDENFFYARIGREYTECSQWRDAAITHIREIKPDILIFSSADAGFTQQQWTTGTARILERVSPVSGRVFLLRDTPTLPFNGPDCLMRRALRPEWLRHFESCSAPAEDARATAIKSWLQTAIARFPNARILDLNGHICIAGTCRAELNDHVVFRDEQHLSASFAISLAEAMSFNLKQLPELSEPGLAHP